MLVRWVYQFGAGGVLFDGGVLVDGSSVNYCNAHLAPLSTVRVGFLHRCDARSQTVAGSSFLHLMQGGESNLQNQIGLGMNPDGTISVFCGINFSGLGGTTLANGATVLSVGKDYWIELSVSLSTANLGGVELRINGITELSFAGIRTSARNIPLIDRISLCAGGGSKHWTGPFYIGDGADGWMGCFAASLIPVSSLSLPAGALVAGVALESIQANAVQAVDLAPAPAPATAPSVSDPMSSIQQALISYGSSAAIDPYWSNVVLLCHMDGTNGQTTTTDSSSAAHAMTINGTGAQLSTAQFKFGTASYDSNAGSGTSNVSTPDSADWDFGSGQFTVEGWIRNVSAPANTRVIVGQNANNNTSWFLGYVSGNLVLRYSPTGTNAGIVTMAGGAWSPSNDVWIHVAADRDASNVVRVYADGVVVGSATNAAAFYNSTATLQIGNGLSAFTRWTGYIDEMRITKGVARYGGAFTPPTTAFPNS